MNIRRFNHYCAHNFDNSNKDLRTTWFRVYKSSLYGHFEHEEKILFGRMLF